MCSETSPRISFSNDLAHGDGTENEHVPRRDTTLLESNSDFEFNISSRLLDYESSLADELFSNGMLLPFQDNKQETSPNVSQNISRNVSRHVSLLPLPSPSCSTLTSSSNSRKKLSNTEIRVSNSELEEKAEPKSTFWGFKRSNSLNCDLKKGSIFSLPVLSRSNSTGTAAPNSKRSSMAKKLLPSTSSGSSTNYVYTFPHNNNNNNNNKPPLKKKYGGVPNCNNGVKISPILNVPPPYIAKGAANLFGLGSLLRNGKEKNRK
ncbi:hypothetical protein JCGZ_05908 [Jatropha curcas]|uniref:Uncharacterized protein n=1 Tax=Jatropha curcas TaxID=180498 RepID=A0A067JKY6_JATCU|nr:rho GTPase-activating protein gacF [Jatropha curcas]KDP20139.1 hypothetical protein JCGZ_05908 [Jatropha curcas]